MPADPGLLCRCPFGRSTDLAYWRTDLAHRSSGTIVLSIARKMRFQPKAASRSQQLCKECRALSQRGARSRALRLAIGCRADEARLAAPGRCARRWHASVNVSLAYLWNELCRLRPVDCRRATFDRADAALLQVQIA